MNDRYHPPSDFLQAIIAEDVPLTGSDYAEFNFRRLIEMTRDDDRANRDWATMLLAQQDIDNAEVRNALSVAAGDADEAVRAEALLGLAQRDRALALPLAIAALTADTAMMPVFEAAELIADPLLADLLRPWTEPSENAYLDQLARKALAACEQGTPVGQSSPKTIEPNVEGLL